jgi:hypothetical protein
MTDVEHMGHSGHLNDELLSDLLQVMAAVPNIDAIFAIIHHGQRLLAGSVLQDARKSGFDVHYGGVRGDESYVSILPAPDGGSPHWVPIPAEKLSIPLVPPGESQSVGYLVLRKDGQRALALAGRRDNGRVTWSGNGDLIDQVSHLLADLGVLRRQKVPSNGQ